MSSFFAVSNVILSPSRSATHAHSIARPKSGSTCFSACAASAVVVLLPCVPLIAIVKKYLEISPKNWKYVTGGNTFLGFVPIYHNDVCTSTDSAAAAL